MGDRTPSLPPHELARVPHWILCLTPGSVRGQRTERIPCGKTVSSVIGYSARVHRRRAPCGRREILTMDVSTIKHDSGAWESNPHRARER